VTQTAASTVEVLATSFEAVPGPKLKIKVKILSKFLGTIVKRRR
jgi:hypothetical protein